MVKIGSNYIGLIFLMLTSQVFAGSLVGELDKNKGSIYDEFVYTLTARGGDLGDEPQFPNIAGLAIRQAGTSQNFSIINGVTTREVQYSFVLTSTSPGSFKIPGIKLEVDGESLMTLPLSLEVAAAAPPAAEDNPEIKIERVFDKSTAYVGEPILRTVKIYSRVNMSQSRASQDIPEMFKKIPIDGERSYRQVLGQYQYNVIEIASVIVPEKSGVFDIEPFRLTTLVPDPKARSRRRDPFGGFFGGMRRIQKNVISKKNRITIKALPKKGRPGNFSGLVGEFEANSSLSQKSVKTGETSTLTIMVQGRGSVEGMRSPLVSFPSSLKVYDDKPVTKSKADRRQGLVSRRIYKYALVPTKIGGIRLGEAKIWVFNTKSERYEALKIDLGSLNVEQGDQAIDSASVKNPLAKKEAVRTLGEDIVGLHRGRSDDGVQGITDIDLLVGGLMQGAGFLFAFSGFLLGRLQTSKVDRLLKKRVSGAFGDFRKSLNRAKDQTETTATLLMAGDAFKIFLGDKLLQEGGSYTTADIMNLLESFGLGKDQLVEAKSVFAQIDMLQYASASNRSAEVDQHVATLESLAMEVDKKC